MYAMCCIQAFFVPCVLRSRTAFAETRRLSVHSCRASAGTGRGNGDGVVDYKNNNNLFEYC